MIECDYLVIGGGIAGCSAAYFLSRDAQVVVLERETQPGYHTTGRSAASFTTVYGDAVIRNLSLAAKTFYDTPSAGFAGNPLLTPLGALFFGDSSTAARVEQLLDEVADPSRLVALSGAQAREILPVLGPQVVAAAYEKNARSIDVHALHQGFIRGLRANGGTLQTDAQVIAVSRTKGWEVETEKGRFHAPVVINASGAWSDDIAELAGVTPLGLRPLRRTALTFRPDGVDYRGWPIAVEISEAFYIKPEGGLLMLSPADETPSPPCDAQPEEFDVANAVEILESWTSLKVPRIEHKWAGLRTFTRDRIPAAGFDDKADGFFWLVGQGGCGIQTAPGLGMFVAALAQGRAIPPELADLGLNAADLAVARLR